MNHSFCVEIAQEYGVNAAILLENIYFWVEKNKANNTNEIDGHFWTYQTQTAFAKMFPYMSRVTVLRALKKLEKDGIILIDNFNPTSYNRTQWYTLTQHGYSLFKMNNPLFKVSTSIVQNEQSNTDITTDINTDNKTITQTDKNTEPKSENQTVLSTSKTDVDAHTQKPKKQSHKNLSKLVIEKYNTCETPFSRVLKSNSKREGLVNARVKDILEFGRQGKTKLFGHCKTELQAVDALGKYFMLAACSEFLCGGGSTGWTADFDYLMSDRGFTKTIEGSHHTSQDEKANAMAVITGNE